MALIFKSKLYRDEIQKWLLILSLLTWASIASFFAFQNKEKLVLVGIDDSGARLITESSDRILQNELKAFLQSFVLDYYGYNEATFAEQIEKASNLMSQELWEIQKPKLLEIKEKLQKIPLSQIPDIEAIDLIETNKVEIILKLRILSKISEKEVKIKVRLNIEKNIRTELNPWGYEITEVSDVVL